MNVLKYVRERRKRLKITQEELADISGVSTAFIKKIEEGHANPSIGILNKLFDAMGLELICREKQPEIMRHNSISGEAAQ